MATVITKMTMQMIQNFRNCDPLMSRMTGSLAKGKKPET